MSHNRRLFGIVLALAAFWAPEPWAQQDSAMPPPLKPLTAPVVVELFTSQSCSSCPPADAVLGELADHNNIIALGCHVTYWDHLDWKDTLSLPACTQRQRDYAAQMGSNQVYTPQMVVNGHVEFVGSRRSTAMREVGKAAHSLKAVRAIALNRSGDTLTAQLPPLGFGVAPQTLWLAPIAKPRTQAIKSGENRGRTVTYTNPVAALVNAGAWNGQAETRTIALPAQYPGAPAIDGYILIAQSPPAGPIVAAGQLPLH